MPDENGKLAPEEFNAAAGWLNTEIKNAGTCVVCKKGKLHLNGMVGQLVNERSTQAYPVLVLICSNCGYVRLHGAIKAGVVRKKEQEDTEKQDVQSD